ncbi:DUF814 domain-containing protein [bacterium]|nr:DUF814 domain-containing protein [bacterium]
MPNDVITLNALANELNTNLSGGRIEKIYQPETDEITLSVKSARSSVTFVISASCNHPRAHITSQKKENALNAPAFCMLLRKHLIGGIIKSIGIFNCDRIIKIDIEARNELNDKVDYFLFAELMGRYSNIILTKSDFVIIDAIRRIHFDQSTSRYILPNLTYELQPKNKISLDEKDKLKDFFEKYTDNDNLCEKISGIGKETAKEILESDKPFDKLMELADIYNQKSYAPCLLIKNNKPIDYFVTKYSSIEGSFEQTCTLNDAFDRFYCDHDTSERKKANTKSLTALLKRLENKTKRRIDDNLKKLEEVKTAEELKQSGDLIFSYISQIKQKSNELVCYDYYNDCEKKIQLDSSLTPSQNAQNYYKRYNKLKRTKEIAESQLIFLQEQGEYLKTIALAIENSTLKVEYDEIIEELNNLNGFKKKANAKKSKIKPSSPMRIKIGNCDIYWGKNNLQNNEVTFNIASGGDMWFHTKNSHGSHVIAKGELSEEIIKRAAEIAAYYSEVRTAERVEVDYCLRKFVKKIPSSMPGLVRYTQYKSIIVTPKKESDN